MGSSRYKFRAWDDEIKKMYYSTPMWRLESLTEGPYWKVMQFTGLLDKNGKEIYEGDVLLGEEIRSRVIFSMGAFCGDELNGWDPMTKIYPLCDSTKNQIIIGNIYSNPELLGAK